MLKKSEPQSLEIYLAHIECELRDLPSQARTDEMREIEAHLRALVLASGQLEDISGTEATATALKQFGAPRAIGKKLRKAWERKQSEPLWRAVASPIAGVIVFALLSLAIQAAINILSPAQFATVIASGGGPMLIFGMYFLLGVGLFLMGFAMGYISPKRGRLIFLLLVTVFCAIAAWPSGIAGISYIGILQTMFPCYICGLVAVLFGLHFGARNGRKRAMRIAK